MREHIGTLRQNLHDERAAHPRNHDRLRLARHEHRKPVALPHGDAVSEHARLHRPPRRRTRTRAQIADNSARRMSFLDQCRRKIGMIPANIRKRHPCGNERRNRRKARIQLHHSPST